MHTAIPQPLSTTHARIAYRDGRTASDPLTNSLLQVRNGKFARVYPSKAEALDGNKSNSMQTKENLLGP